MLQIQTPTDQNQRATPDKSPRHNRNQCRLLKKQRQPAENTQNHPGNKNNGANDSILNKNTSKKKNNNYKKSNRVERRPETVYLPCETYGETNHSQEICFVRTNAANRLLPCKSKPAGQGALQQKDAHDSITGCVRAAVQHLNYKCLVFTPEL